MSVWTKVQTKVLAKSVEMKLFEEALKDLELTLDHSKTEIKNSFGKSRVDAMLRFKGNETALGIIRNAEGGIDLLGDTWRSGIVGDKQQDKLVNMMSQVYQKHKLKRDLELQGWTVETVQKGNKIELEITQW